MDENQRKVIIDLQTVLKDFEPMVKNPQFLRTGRTITNFSLRPREAWANWLLCAALRKMGDPDTTFAEDDECDGFIVDPTTGHLVPTEHVAVLDVPSKKPGAKGDQGVVDAINHKISRGPEYAQGKYLVVFFEGLGTFFRNQIRMAVRGKHNFQMVYGIGLITIDPQSGYRYVVTQFHDFHSVSYFVDISYDFTNWTVTQAPLPN